MPEDFLKTYRVKQFAKGEVILTEDEKPACAYQIKSGVVKTYNLTTQGQEKPISFEVAGEILPVGWIFGTLRYTQYFYEAFTDCELYCVNKEEFLEYLQRKPAVMYSFLDRMVRRNVYYQMRINALEQSKAADKVVHTLYFLCMRYGQQLKPGAVQIQLPLTQQDLANFMGLTRETTGIELKKLERAKVIKYFHQRYQVYPDRLNDLLDSEYGQGFEASE